MRWAAVLLCSAALGASAQIRVGEVSTDAAAGSATIKSVSPGGAEVMSGSAVSAAGRAATLKLDRGGAVRLCPRTTATASTSASGRELMLALDSGTLELDYQLAASSDSVLTPDLRLTVSGPSSVHIAVDVKPSGDVCVASLEGNNATVVVSELAGEGSYQVRPGEQIAFSKGTVSQPHADPAMSCGCPAEAPIQRAANSAPPSSPASTATEEHTNVVEERPAAALALPPATVSPTAAAQPPAEASPVPSHVVVEMDAPMVYSGQKPSPPSDTLAEVRIFRTADDVLLFPPVALPPQPPPAPVVVQPAGNPAPTTTAVARPSHGFFHRVGAFFASLFR